MANTTTHFELVTPEALSRSEPVGMAVLPGVEGDLGVLVQHMPLITQLRPGVIALYPSLNAPSQQRLFVAGGIAEIDAERCIVLTEEALDLADIDAAQAQARLSEAEAARDAAVGEGELQRASRELTIAQALVAALSA